MVKTKQLKDKLIVFSDLFDDCNYFRGEAARKTKIGQGGKYYNFLGDNPIMKDYTTPEAGYDHANKMAIANWVMAMSLWKKGIAECNDFVKNYRGGCKNVVINCPGEVLKETDEQ